MQGGSNSGWQQRVGTGLYNFMGRWAINLETSGRVEDFHQLSFQIDRYICFKGKIHRSKERDCNIMMNGMRQERFIRKVSTTFLKRIRFQQAV